MRRGYLPLLCIVLLLPASMAISDTPPRPPLVIAYANAWAPMSEGDGRAVTGFLPSLMQALIQERMDYPVIHMGLPWGRAQSAVQSGVVDAFVTTPTEARLDYARGSSNVVYALRFRAFTTRDSPYTDALQAGAELGALESARFCDVLGNGWAQRFYQSLDLPVFWAPEIEHCLRMLVSGRTDVVVHSTAVMRLKIRRLDLDSVVRMYPRVYPGADFTLLISKASPIPDSFLTEFDRLLDRLKDSGDYEPLVNELLDATLDSYSFETSPR